MKKIILWTRYGKLGASSRLRFYNFVPFLGNAGWQVAVHNFFDDSYLHKLYSGGGKSIPALFAAWWKRLKEMADAPADVPALIEYELLPYLPFAAEKKFLDSRRFVLNFDDDVFLRYRNMPLLKNKFPELLRRSSGVICANEHLLETAGKWQENLCKIPTVPPPVLPERVAKASRFTVVWTGNPATFPYLAAHAGILRKAAEKCDFQLLIVGGGKTLPGVDCRLVPWSESAEDHALKYAHVGIMPLPDTPFARGKSAYKLIRYLQYGLPAVASPVGENLRVLQHGVTGFFAGSAAEWTDALCRLANPAVREIMGSAIAAAAEKYRPESAAETLNDFLTAALF